MKQMGISSASELHVRLNIEVPPNACEQMELRVDGGRMRRIEGRENEKTGRNDREKEVKQM